MFEKLDRDDNGRLTVSEFLDYVFEDDSAAGQAVETIDQIKEFLDGMKLMFFLGYVKNAMENGYF